MISLFGCQSFLVSEWNLRRWISPSRHRGRASRQDLVVRADLRFHEGRHLARAALDVAKKEGLPMEGLLHRSAGFPSNVPVAERQDLAPKKASWLNAARTPALSAQALCGALSRGAAATLKTRVPDLWTTGWLPTEGVWEMSLKATGDVTATRREAGRVYLGID